MFLRKALALLLLLLGASAVSAQQVTFSPTSVSFGLQGVAITSPAQTLTLTNTGTSTLTFSSNATISGTNAAEFVVSPSSTCANGASVTAGNTCTILMTFTPAAAGVRSAVVSISDNASGSPHTAQLSGNGIVAANNQITLNCPLVVKCVFIGQVTMTTGTPVTPASVTISPASGSVPINGTFPLVATVANDPATLGVTWTVSGTNCTGAACGTISPTSSMSNATVTYTAPPTSPVGSVFISATAVANQASFQSNITVVTPTPPPVGPTGVNVFAPSCAHASTTTTCSFTNYAGPTMVVNITPVTTSSGVTGVQACKSGTACAGLTLTDSIAGVYQYRGINIGAGFNQVVVASTNTSAVNVAISDTANVGAFDTSATKSGSATINPTGPPLTTATANELVVCALGTSGVASAAASPFVFDVVGNKDGYAAAINPTASAISPSWTTTNAAYSSVCGAYGVGTAPPAISVVNNPLSVNVQSSLTQQFTATVGNDAANQGVTWSATCSSGPCGSFSPTTTGSGQATTYTAPALVPPGASVSLLQHPKLLDQTSPFTIPISSSTAGTTLCVFDVWNTGAGTMTVADSAGETWPAAIDVLSQSGLTGSYDCLPNNVGGVASITVAVSGSSPTSHELYAREYSGLLTSGIVDSTPAHAPGFVIPMDSGFMGATTNANDVLIGFGFNGASSSFTAGNDGQGDNYGNLDQQTFLGSAVEDFFTTSATNTYKATMAPSAASGSGMMVVALKAGTGTGTGNANITITATSVANPTKSASSTVTLTAATPPISVVVNQSGSTLTAGTGTISITPTVSNDTGAAGVTWTLNGLGSISPMSSATGTPTVYTPPASVSTATSVTITATSVTDTTKSAVATILVNPVTQTGGGGTVACNPACPAFTGAGGTAEGSGAATVGGSGGTVILVKNLNDTGAGSLRACLTATGPRICLPVVSGVITVFSRLQIFNPNVTVAGQTVPGGGLVIKEAPACTSHIANNPNVCDNANECQSWGVGCGAPFTSTHDVVFRYLSYDGSANTPTGPDFGTVGFETTSGNVFNVMYANISCYHWGNACIDIFSNGQTVTQITVQRSLFYEPGEEHPIIIKSDTTSGSAILGTNRDYHHNVAVNYARRWGLFNSRSTRWVNNISYNGQNEDGDMDFKFYAWGGLQADLIGNKYVDGPQTLTHDHTYLFQSNPCSSEDPSNSCPSTNPGPPSLYMLNNIGPICSATVTNSCTPRTLSTPTSAVNDASEQAQTFQGWEGGETPNGGIPIAPVPGGWYRSTPLAAPTFPITVDDVTTLDAKILGTVGNSQHLDCQGNFVSNRSAEDARVIQQYINRGPGGNYGTHNPSDPGYSPDYNGLLPPNQTASVPTGTVCPMTFVTGIFDGWLIKFGLPTNDPTLGPKKDQKSQYTYEDDFLNGIIPTKPN